MLNRFASKRWALIMVFSVSAMILLSLIVFRKETTMADEDHRLITRIREAIASNIPIEDLGRFVGIRPAFNSSESHLMVLRLVRFKFENDKGGICNLRNAKNVVYWVRPIRSENRHVVGIVWDNEGGVSMCYGESQLDR